MAKHLFSSSFRTRRDRRNSVSTGSFAPDGQDDAVMRRTPLARAGAFAMALLMAFSPMQQTQAQIIADPNAPRSQQPVILPTANGLPQVNIQTPSAGGVSRNTYSQFDVQQQGAILNNARTNVQTQLGGWVQANPYLATGTARVILNEVNSSNPSQLRGYVEVAGDRAQVVIANPAGVTCDGCGFVNANRVTLTSGSAMVNGGSLDGYAVRGGNVIVQGGGLDASQADYTDIIARAVQINAGIWSKELRISTGVNQVNADHTQVSASSSGSGSGSAPAFAIDVAQLGGMYANKIVLIGTETGLGMRNAGTLLASSSDLVLQNNGWLSNSGSMQAGGNLQVTTQGDFSNSGTTYAGNDQTLHVATQINNSGALLAQGNNSITADSFNSGSGSVLGAGIKSDGSYATSGSLSVTTTHALAANGQNLAAADLGLSGSSVDLSGSQTDAANITLSASSGGVSTASASVATGGTLSISAASTGSSGLDNSQGKLIAGQLAFDVASLNNNHGQIQQIGTGASSIAMTSATGVIDNGNGTLASNGSLSLSAAALNNDAGRISSGGSLSITQSAASGILSNRSGTLIANDDVTLNGAIVDNTRGTLIAINGNLAVTSSGVTRNDGGIMQAGLDATLNNTGLSNGLATGADASSASAYGSISAATLHIDTAGQALSNTGGTLAASQSASIISGAFDNSGGLVQSGGDLSIDTQGAMLTNSNAADYLNSNAQLNGQGGIVAQGVTTIAAGNLINDAGYLGSRGNLNARLNTLRNSAGRVLAQSDLSLTLQGDVSNSGQLITGGTLDLRAGNIDNTASGEITGTLTKISASGTLTNRGLIDGSDTRIDADTVNNIGSGRIYGDHLSIAANTLRNDTETVNGVTQAATIAARNRLDLGIAGTLTNREHALIYSAGDMAIGGSLDSNRNATGAAGTINNNSATIEAGGALSMSSAVLNNTNEHLAYQVVIDKQRAVSDFVGTDGGVIDSSEVSFVINYPNPGYDMGTGKLIPVSAGITDAQRTYYFGPDPITRSVCNGGGDNETCTPEVVNIGLNDPMWGYFGITPPTTTGLVCIVENGDGCVAAQREAAWYTLQNKVSELRATVNAAIVYFKVSRDYTETTYKAEVTSTDPARIASGGAMTLNTSGTLLNANSNILAGGALNIIGAAVNNQALQVTTNTTFSGTSRDYAIVGKDCGGWFSGCSDIWQVRTMAYNAAQPHVVNLSVAQSIGNTAVTSSTSGAATRSNASVNAGSSNGSNAGGRGNGAILAYPLAVTSADGSNIVRTNDQAIQLPDSSLYQTKPDPSASYLIETDPRFSNQRQWLNSSYLTQSLSLDPGVTQKRLGDGYYEQQLIRDQVAQLTGRRFLGNYSSDEAQYQALMNNAISFARQTNLQPGIALTAEQVAQLTSDIVWLVQKTVTLADGTTQNVLVPQLYVVARAGDLDSSGSLLAGSDVNLQLSGDLSNSGQIAGRQVVQINAANINNLGGSINGDTVNVVAQQDINNTGGSISAVSSLTALAGRDLNIASTVQSTDSAVMQRQDVDRVAGLYVTGATGVLQAGAGRDVNLTAAAIVNSGTGATVVAAGNNLNLNSVQTVDSINATWNAQNYSRYGTQSEVGSAINGGGAVQLVAGNDLTARTATVQATGALSLTAGNDLNILAGQSSQSVAQAYHAEGSGFLKSASVTSRTSMSNTQALASNLDGASVTLQAGKDINVVGSNVLSDTATTLAAGGDIKIAAATETATQSSMFEEKSSGLSFGAMGPSYSKSSSKDTYDATAVTESQSASTIGSRNGTVSITADQDVTVRGSNVVGLGDVSLTATNGAVSVVAAQDSSQTAATHEQSHSSFGGSYSAGVASVGFGKSSASAQSSVESLLHYGSSVVSTDGNTRMQAGQGLSVVASGVSAGQNLTLIGSSVDLSAAQDIVVEHNAQQSSSSGFSVGMTVNPLAAFSSAFKQSASNNPSTSILGKSTKYADATTDGLAAATTTVVVQAGSRSASAAQDHATSTAQVSSLTAGNNLTVLATGSNITSQGATMSSEGDATLVAKDNINLDVAHNYETQGQTSVASGWSIDNRGTMPLGVFDNNAKGNGSSDTVSGSSLSAGRSATLGTTDGDITLTAANVVAQDDLSINAAKNLTIQSGQNSVSNANQTDNQAIGKVVVSDTERFSGYHSENSTGNNNAVTQVASSVGSLQGSVTLAAGETYTQRASNLLAANDIDITAKALDITTANNSGSSAQSSDSLKVGTFSRVSSPLIDLINNAKNAAKSDGRLQAMQTLATAANAYQAYSALNGGSGSIVKAEAGVGFATADSQDQSRYVQAQGSTIQGGGNVNLSSTEGDITATGAKISAGDTLTLDSARDILLTAGKNSVASSGDNHNAGVEVGVGASVGAETGVYVYASASIGSGKYDLNANTNSNTQLSGNTVTLKSQDDTTLKGAEVHANTINADVGGKLAIESVQDTVTQNSEQSSVGGRVQISIGTAWNASANLSQSQGNGSSAIVTSQSGLFAGDGGYHVTADSVALKGGAIASTNAANSELTAQSISFEDIANKMEYSASTMSVSGGYGEKTAKSDTAGSTGSSDPKTASPAQNPSGGSNPSLMPGMIMQESGSSSGTTYATLTEGNIKIGGQSTSAAELGAHTDLATANAAVEALPDVKNLMQEQQAMAAAANTVIATAAQFANDRAAAAANQAKKETEKIAKADQGVADAQKSLNAVLADGASSESDKNNAQQALDTAKQSRDSAQQALTTATAAAANWGPTGDYTRALKAITGVLVGGVAGQSVGQLAANASAPYIANAIGNYFSQPGNENQTAQVLSHAVLGGLLAAANGGSAAGGAVAGAGGELAAQAITKALYPKAFDENGDFHPEKLDDAQKNVVIALSSAVGAMLGGVTGGTTQDALVGANVAANAATNNQLSAKEIDAKLAAIKNCNADTKCVSDVERKYNRLAYLHANGAFNNGVMSKAMLESDRQELQQKLQGGECNMPSACYAEVTRSINEIDSLIASMPGREKALTMLEYASVAVDVGSVLLGIVELRIAAKAAAALGKVATTGGTNSAGVVTSVGTANVASGVKLADDLAANMVKPIVTDTKLSGLMDDLYRDGAKIGTGSTADAVRYETATGTPVGNVFHSQKAQDYSVALQKWLEANPTASFSDRSAAQNVLRDLQNSLKGK